MENEVKINWANDYGISETIYSLRNSIAAMYTQAKHIERKKQKPNKAFLEMVHEKGLEAINRPISNLFFESEKKGWDFINEMQKEYEIAKHLFETTKHELSKELVLA
jgi:hypothetical protein